VEELTPPMLARLRDVGIRRGMADATYMRLD
jgi:hypothetical protein